MDNNTQLPAEVAAQITKEAELYATVQWGDKSKFVTSNQSVHWGNSMEDWEAGATEYATKLLAADKANSVLEENNRRLNETLNEARQHLEQVLLYISGTSPIHEKIQTFLDETK